MQGSVLRAAEPSTKGLISTPNATCSERINFTSEEFLSQLRFDQRSRLTELEMTIDRTGHHER